MKTETLVMILIGLAVAGAAVYFFILRPRTVGAPAYAQPEGNGFVDTANPNMPTADGSSGYAAPVVASDEAKANAAKRLAGLPINNVVDGPINASIFDFSRGANPPATLPASTNIVTPAPMAINRTSFVGVAPVSSPVATMGAPKPYVLAPPATSLTKTFATQTQVAKSLSSIITSAPTKIFGVASKTAATTQPAPVKTAIVGSPSTTLAGGWSSGGSFFGR